MARILRALLLVTTVALAALPAGSAAAATSASESVTLAEFTLTPQGPGLRRAAGTWTFSATNAGSFQHTLNLRPSVGGADLAATGPIAPGQAATLPALVLTPGSYRLYCAFHPSSMHVDLVFAAPPSSGAPTVDGVTATAATVHVVANANGSTGAVLRLHVAPAATPTGGATFDLPIAGFSDQPLTQALADLLPDTEYVAEANAHAGAGDAAVQTTTFRTAPATQHAPTLTLLLPTSATVAAWRAVRATLDPGTASVAAVQVEVRERVHRRCYVYANGRFRPGPCGGPPRVWSPTNLAAAQVSLTIAGLRPGLVRVTLRAVDQYGSVLATSGPVWRRLAG